MASIESIETIETIESMDTSHGKIPGARELLRQPRCRRGDDPSSISCAQALPPDTVPRMGHVPSVVDLVQQLRAFHGHRTVWLDADGSLVHAEPDEELEDLGYRYVATLMRPGPEALAEALGRAGVVLVPTSATEACGASWIAAPEPASA